MEIFTVNINEFAANVVLQSKNKIQTAAGRFLTEYAAKNIYNIQDTEIKIKNRKPYFVNSDLNFNIAHSGELAAVCFDAQPVGFDLEQMKERDFKALLARYKIPTEDAKTVFYRFWCEYEAKIKLQTPEKSLVIFQLSDDYMCAAASAVPRDIAGELKIYRLKFPSMEIEEIQAHKFFEPLQIKI
jgi:hypothetical protein